MTVQYLEAHPWPRVGSKDCKEVSDLLSGGLEEGATVTEIKLECSSLLSTYGGYQHSVAGNKVQPPLPSRGFPCMGTYTDEQMVSTLIAPWSNNSGHHLSTILNYCHVSAIKAL